MWEGFGLGLVSSLFSLFLVFQSFFYFLGGVLVFLGFFQYSVNGCYCSPSFSIVPSPVSYETGQNKSTHPEHVSRPWFQAVSSPSSTERFPSLKLDTRGQERDAGDTKVVLKCPFRGMVSTQC